MDIINKEQIGDIIRRNLIAQHGVVIIAGERLHVNLDIRIFLFKLFNSLLQKTDRTVFIHIMNQRQFCIFVLFRI